MAIPKFEDDLRIISKLGNNPGTDNGYTTQEFKEAFDKAPLLIQRFINEVLIPAANASSSPQDGLSMQGPINMNGNRIEGIGNPVDDQDAVPLKVANDLIGTAVGTAKNELSRKLCVPNLLDNSDFTNPVNQRGFVSGTGGEGSYSLDRWRLEYDTKLHLHSGYVGISGYWSLSQKNGCKLLAGKTYTFAIEAKSEAETGAAFVRMGNPDGTGASEHRQDINASEWTKCSSVWTADRDYEPGEAVFAFGINSGTKLDTQIYYRNPVVYEGEYTADTLPEYQPKGYANELLACNVADSGNVSGMKLLWENASPASAFAAQTISLDLSGYDFVFISCFASNYGGGTDKESHFALKGEKTTLLSQGSVFSSRDVTVSATGLTFTDGVQRPTYGNWTGNTDNYGIVPDKIYGIKGVSA